MTFSVNNIPQIITGTDPRPSLYGKTASQWQHDLLQQADDEFQRSGNTEPLEKVAGATVRYTPPGTIAKGSVTNEAVNNAIGYAKQDIENVDKDGNGAINKDELADLYKKPFVQVMTGLKNQYKALEKNPNADQATKDVVLARINEKYDELTKDAAKAQVKAGNYFTAVDVKDQNGLSDGKLTADEIAAKTLFDDAALDMFNDNQQAYQTVIHGLETKTDYTGPSLQQLQTSIDTIQQKPRAANQPLAMDGQVTNDERKIAEKLVEAPIPTNQIISNIHQVLNLKSRVSASNTTTGPTPTQTP